MTAPLRERGFTLIEMLIALALFGLISLAGFALVDSVLRVQARTDGRLERLAGMQRAMYLLARDIEQVGDGPIVVQDMGLTIQRRSAGSGSDVPVRYGLRDGWVERVVGNAEGGHVQRLVEGVVGLRWRFYDRGEGWLDRWPPSPQRGLDRPAAIAIDITLTPGREMGGSLRRVVALPARP